MAVQHGTEESGSPKSRCVLITRTIVDLKNYVDDAKALDFTEITENDKTERLEMDETCASLLSQLKTRTKGLISNKNSLEYDVLWRYEDVIHPKLHAKYLDKLCNEFHDIMKQLIDETVPNTKFDIEPEIFEEVLHHWTCCQRKVVDFCGQEGFLNSIRTYISGKTEKPFVVYGPSGSGKTTILSKIATEVRVMFFCLCTVSGMIAEFIQMLGKILTLKAPITAKIVCLCHLLECLRSLFDKQCRPRSDCSCRSSQIWVHTVCRFTYINQ